MSTLVGRVAEQRALRAAIDDARAGRGRLLLLAGPPGIGKSALVGTGVEHALDVGLEVVRGHAVNDPGAPPLWPWRRLLPPGVPGAGTSSDPASDGAPRGESDAQARFRRFVEITDSILDRAARGNGLLLVFEDLHWADELSIRLLVHLVAELDDRPIAVLVTARDTAPGPLADALPELTRGARAQRLVLGGP